MTGTVLIRREAIDQRGLGFVNPGYPSYDDYLLYLTLALDWEFAYESRIVMRYRRHSGNLTNVLLSGNIAWARVTILNQFLARFPDARKRLGREHRRVLARLLIAAAAHECAQDPILATRWALSGLSQHPASALAELGRGIRVRIVSGGSR
jgi:hypothetical protein